MRIDAPPQVNSGLWVCEEHIAPLHGLRHQGAVGILYNPVQLNASLGEL